MGKKTVGVDFDGVIHKYEKGWTGVIPIEGPMEGAEEGLKTLVEMGFIVKIFTTRPAEYVNPWLVKYGLDKYVSGVSNVKFPAAIYIDDRGYRFENWSDTLNSVRNIFPKK